MKDTDFAPRAPGRLVLTEFSEKRGDQLRVEAGKAFVPDALPPKLDRGKVVIELFELHQQAMCHVVRLDAKVDAMPMREMLLQSITWREVQASSRIEDTVASLEELALAKENPAAVRDEVREVLRNRQAVEYALESPLPACRRLLSETHEVLMRTDDRARPGQVRDRQVYIGDKERGFAQARFVPPPGPSIAECLAQWERFANPSTKGSGARERYPYFIELAMLHYQFEAIHPFSDGNGRLGRVMITVAPVKDKELRWAVCNISEWVQERRSEYTDRLLRVSTHGEWTAWFKFFCTALAEQAMTDMKRVDRVFSLYERYQERYKSRKNGAPILKILDQLFQRYALTVGSAAQAGGISFPTAQKYIDILVADKVLRQIGPQKRDRLFLASEILDAVKGSGGLN